MTNTGNATTNATFIGPLKVPAGDIQPGDIIDFDGTWECVVYAEQSGGRFADGQPVVWFSGVDWALSAKPNDLIDARVRIPAANAAA